MLSTLHCVMVCLYSSWLKINQNPVFVPGVWGPYFSAMVPGLWLNEGGQSVTGKLVRAYSTFTETGATQTMETNQMAEPNQ